MMDNIQELEELSENLNRYLANYKKEKKMKEMKETITRLQRDTAQDIERMDRLTAGWDAQRRGL